jgi:hypothetical protein
VVGCVEEFKVYQQPGCKENNCLATTPQKHGLGNLLWLTSQGPCVLIAAPNPNKALVALAVSSGTLDCLANHLDDLKSGRGMLCLVGS